MTARCLLLAPVCVLLLSGCTEPVERDNLGPAVTILAPEDGTSSEEGAELLFRGEVSDPESEAEDLSLTWSSSLDGVLLEASSDSEGISEWSSSTLSVGTHVVTLEVEDPEGVSDSDEVEVVVTAIGPGNQSPTISIGDPEDGGTYPASSPLDLSASVSDAEDSPEDLLVTWSVESTGEVLASELVPGGDGSCEASASLDAGTWTLVATVTDTEGDTGSDTVTVTLEVSQTAPTAPTVGITPATPNAGDDLTCVVSAPATDAEGDTLSYDFAWTQDGNTTAHVLAGSLHTEVLTVPASDTTGGQEWTCTVTANDGTQDGDPGSATVTVATCMDIDGDCYPDLVMSNSTQTFPSTGQTTTYDTDSFIFYGTPTGPNNMVMTLLPTHGARASAVADLDADGFTDIVFANERSGDEGSAAYATDSWIYWGGMAGHGTGAAQRSGLPTRGARDVEVADLDLDGHLDLVFANAYDGSGTSGYLIDSYVYWGSATGFDSGDRTDLPTRGAEGVAVGDLDGDTYPDLVFANYFNGSSHSTDSTIYWGSASGFDAADRTELPTAGATDVDLGDFDNDGVLDLVFANSVDPMTSLPGTDSYVYWGSPGGVYSEGDRTDLPTRGAYGVTAADFNGDGEAELVFSNRYEGGYYTIDSYVYWGSASAGYSTSDRTSLATQGARGSAVADLDFDGEMDLVFANVRSGTATFAIDSYLYWGTGNASAPFSSSHTPLPTVGASGVSIALP